MRICILLILIFQSNFFWASLAQQSSKMPEGINVSFLKGVTETKAGELASNVIKVINNTGRSQSLNLTTVAPGGWAVLGLSQKNISVNAGDSLFVPVRLKSIGELKGNVNYNVNIYLSSSGIAVANALWTITVEKNSVWQVIVPSKQVYVTEENDSCTFLLRILNSGNSDERLSVTVDAESGIALTHKYPSSTTRNEVNLPVNADTVLYYSIAILQNKPKSDLIQEKEESKLFRLKVNVESLKKYKSTNRIWSGNIDIIKVPSEIHVNPAPFESLPITVEFDAYNIVSSNTYSSLNVYGTKEFTNDNGFLTYYYQADFVRNQLDGNSFLGNYQYAGYYSDQFNVEVGSIGANKSGSTLNGKGIKGSYKYKNHRAGALYIRYPYLLENINGQGVGGFYTFKNKKTYIDAYAQYDMNESRKINSALGMVEGMYHLKSKHFFRGGFGYSKEEHFWNEADVLNVIGYGGQLGYSTSINKYQFNLNSYYGSPSYTPRKGVLSVSSVVGYSINDAYRLGAYASVYEFKPELYNSGELVNDTIFNNRQLFSIKLMHEKREDNYVFSPLFYMNRSSGMNANTGGATFEYRKRGSGQYSLFANVFGGYSSFSDFPELGEIFIANMRASLRFPYWQSSVRYYYGPYYTIDQVEYTQTGENSQKIFTTFYGDKWFAHNRIRLNFNLSHFYSTIRERHQLSSRPELFYYAKNGFECSLYGRYMLMGNGEYYQTVNRNGTVTQQYRKAENSAYTEFGFGVKVNLNAPIGLPKNFSAEMVVFKDLNGNDVKDSKEEGIGNVLLKLIRKVPETELEENELFRPLAIELITDEKGVANFINVEQGDYIIEAMPLTSQGGWYDVKRYYRTIDKRKRIYLPFSKGARIGGIIVVERDRFTDEKALPLNDIRITAVNRSNGNTYSSLTDKSGSFTMYVPNGAYLIVVNEDAVSSRFSFIQSEIPLDVNDQLENYNITFQLVEQKRNIRFSKPKSSLNKLGSEMIPSSTKEQPLSGQSEMEAQENASIQEAVGKIESDETVEKINFQFQTIETTDEKVMYRIEIEESLYPLTAADFVGYLTQPMIIYQIRYDDVFHYSIGEYRTEKEASKGFKKMQKEAGLKEGAIVQYKDVP